MVRKSIAAGLMLLAALLGMQRNCAQAQSYSVEVLPRTVLERRGLHRQWITRVELDPSRGRIRYVTLFDDMLLVQTSEGTLHALEPETGATRWVAHIGRPGFPSYPASSNGNAIAVCAGSTLYLLNAERGNVTSERRLTNMPGAGAAISDREVYVPLMDGMVTCYGLAKDAYRRTSEAPTSPAADMTTRSSGAKETPTPTDRAGRRRPALGEGYVTSTGADPSKRPPVIYRGKGIADAQPLLAGGYVIWGTSEGFVYGATETNLQAGYRYRTRGPISTQAVSAPPVVIIASRDGYTYGLRENTGAVRWRFSTGVPILQTPVVVGESVYVVPDGGGMHCLSSQQGFEQWHAPSAQRFLAASPTRIYAADPFGRLTILDRVSGTRLDRLDTSALDVPVVNTRHDRVYFASATGLVICLREQALEQPAVHQTAKPEQPEPAKARGRAAKDAAAPAATEPADGEEEDGEPDPFAAEPAVEADDEAGMDGTEDGDESAHDEETSGDEAAVDDPFAEE